MVNRLFPPLIKSIISKITTLFLLGNEGYKKNNTWILGNMKFISCVEQYMIYLTRSISY